MNLIKQLRHVAFLFLVILTLYISNSCEENVAAQPADQPPPAAPQPADQPPPAAAPPNPVDTNQPVHEEPKKEEHHHDDGDKSDPLRFAKDVGHIREHLKEQYGFNDEQANQYLKEYDAQTQFFVMHDYDNNTKLDGLELLKSMTHYHDEHEESHDGNERDNSETLVEFVDMILKDQDYNDDGYIDYPEYITYYSKFDHNTPPATPETTAHS